MFTRGKRIAVGAAAAALAGLLASSPVSAESPDIAFFNNAQGKWSGKGAFINTKLNGTKFNCTLSGTPQSQGTGFELKGKCKVGLFGYPMNAVITKSKGTYKGTFLDGANGGNAWGFDIVSGKISGKKMEINLKAAITGSLVASLRERNSMRITLNVNHPKFGAVSIAYVDLTRNEEPVKVGSAD